MLSEWRESRHRPRDNIEEWLRTRRWMVSEKGHTSHSLEDMVLARRYELHDMLDSEVRELLADGRVEAMVGADAEQAAEFERVLQRDRDRLHKARKRAEVLMRDPMWRIEELNSGPLRKLSMLRMTDPAGHLDRHCEIIDCLKWGREHIIYVEGLHHVGFDPSVHRIHNVGQYHITPQTTFPGSIAVARDSFLWSLIPDPSYAHYAAMPPLLPPPLSACPCGHTQGVAGNDKDCQLVTLHVRNGDAVPCQLVLAQWSLLFAVGYVLRQPGEWHQTWRGVVKIGFKVIDDRVSCGSIKTTATSPLRIVEQGVEDADGIVCI